MAIIGGTGALAGAGLASRTARRGTGRNTTGLATSLAQQMQNRAVGRGTTTGGSTVSSNTQPYGGTRPPSRTTPPKTPYGGSRPPSSSVPPSRNRSQQIGQALAKSQSQVSDYVDRIKGIASSAPKFDASGVDKQVNALARQLAPSSSPDMPAQINLDDYRTQMATIADLSEKYGFDYSRDYAEQQAEVLAQAQRDEIQTARERQEHELQSAQTDLEHDFFQQFLQQRQSLADHGLNAGIAAERDTRLGMNLQNAMADILANAQLYNQELDRRMATIAAEEQAYADRLYNERLQQGFQNTMDINQFRQSENQAMLQAAMEQRAQRAEEIWREYEFNNMSEAERQQMLQKERQFGTEMAWREYEFNNMSEAERQRLVAEAERFGTEMAWQRHKFEAGLAFDSGASGEF